MSATISLALPEYHPGVVTSFTPGWTTLAKIFRTETFKKVAEMFSLFGFFAVMGLWLLIIPTL